MQIAVVQHDIAWQDAPTTTQRLEPFVARAANAGARLIILTEMFATGFSMHPELIAEPAGGPTEQWLVSEAGRHSVWLLGSIAQHSHDGRAVNVAVLAAPDGHTERYEKMHPFSYAGEHQHYQAGNKPLTVDVEGLRTSIFICYDLRFADDFWDLAHDTDCYVVVANWPAARREHWQTLLRARAIENQAYVIGANRVGVGGGVEYVGDSAIIDPLGRSLAEGSHQQTVLGADVDWVQVRDVRARYPFLADRRRPTPIDATPSTLTR